jgi:DegV family protein with EDD domain
MPGVHIVTDSACDLTPSLAAAHGIEVVPLSIRFGAEEFLDGRDLDPDDFWLRCKASPTLPTTAAPPPGAFLGAYDRAQHAGADAVVCITLSSVLSATYQSALNAAKDAPAGCPVHVVDSRSVTMGQGILAIRAAEAAATGAGADDVVSALEREIPRVQVFGVVATLDHLQRGGRIGGAKALLGSLLAIKPVIQVRDGAVAEESKQRTRSRSLEYLAHKVAQAAPLERLAVCNGAADDIDTACELLASIEVAEPLTVVDLGPVVGTHVGPGTIGACFLPSSG